MTKAATFRAVFDTNIIIAALKSKNPGSPTIELLRRWSAGEFTLLYCDDLQAEYQEKFVSHNIPLELRASFLANLLALGEYVEVTPDQVQHLVLADPDDDIVIACALVGQATHLVTYDPHLLNLGQTVRGVTILDGLHFLYLVRGDTPPDKADMVA
ncbi:MAG TPA: putative toxin-antitoxin system toxin component, PIN family [Chloroflexota bacterium]|nr:putative toxin-antitoxin system toxin component, PIN family [Chloroflexota bacterium]HUM69760.1 putative toxin-antitoxin system toxin component, PIN family [Chloroflexota bacterium]